MNSDVYPPGTLKMQGSPDLTVSPQDPLYSLVSLLATEYWDCDTNTWLPICDESKDDE